MGGTHPTVMHSCFVYFYRTIQCMIKCGMMGGFCKTVNVVRNDDMLLCYISVFGQPDTTEVAIAGFDDSTLYRYAIN